ncbi:MAG: helix-turn-helix transcriptional regulator [Ginsengibacter sp.]
MANYHDNTVTKEIGRRIKNLREAHEFEIEDISEMTGFAYQTIQAIENGSESSTTYLVEIAYAIGVHPEQLFIGLPLKIKSRFKLSAKRKEKTRLTSRINQLLESNYFETARFVKDVFISLKEDYKIKTTSSSISVILLRFKKEKKLKTKKIGRNNQYFNIK